MTRAALIAFGLTLAACSSSSGGNFCSDFNSSKDKFAPCEGDAGTSTATDGGLTEASCTTIYNSSACSSSDRTALDSVASCYSALPTCSPATETSFVAQEEACLYGDGGFSGGYRGVSESCNTAFFSTF